MLHSACSGRAALCALQAHQLTQVAMQRISEFNRRTLDALAARIYFYWAWTTEKTGELAAIRSQLLALHRTAVLRHDEYGQETLLNLLLRNYLHYNQYEQVGSLRFFAWQAAALPLLYRLGLPKMLLVKRVPSGW